MNRSVNPLSKSFSESVEFYVSGLSIIYFIYWHDPFIYSLSLKQWKNWTRLWLHLITITLFYPFYLNTSIPNQLKIFNVFFVKYVEVKKLNFDSKWWAKVYLLFHLKRIFFLFFRIVRLCFNIQWGSSFKSCDCSLPVSAHHWGQRRPILNGNNVKKKRFRQRELR